MLQTLTQKLSGLSYYAKLALALSAYQAIFIACLEAFVFSKHLEIVSILTPNANATQHGDESGEEYANARSISVYHVLFIVAQFFQLGIYIDAIHNQNTIQIIALMLFEFGILIYSVIQVYQSVQILKTVAEQINILPYEITIIVLIFILANGFAYLAYKLYQEFGWSIYKKIGADMAMRDRYKMYQIFIMLLKFDLFFFVGLSVQILVLVIFIAKGQADQSQQIAEHIIMSSVISTSMLMAAFLGVKKENKPLMYLFMVGCVGTEVYFTIKLVDISTHPQKYLGTRIFATFFVCICMILGAVTLVISALCLRNFNKGLKYHLSRDCNNENETGDQFPPGNNGFNLESVRGTIKRWSID